jgi:uncharacterized protein involved in propanediol utilization
VLVVNPAGPFHVFPEHKAKARRVAELTAALLRVPPLGGTLTITSNIPEGKGYGSSTADCVAVVRAVAAAFGRRICDRVTARLCVQAEVASDNVMFDTAVLFAQRDGLVVEDYRVPFPALEVIGIDVDPRGFVDTLQYPPAEYGWRQVQTFGTLVAALRRAFVTEDLDLLGRIATASALINEPFLPKPFLADVRQLAQSVHALGICAAHSGTLIGILLHPADPLLAERMAYVFAELDGLQLGHVFRFRTAHTADWPEVSTHDARQTPRSHRLVPA